MTAFLLRHIPAFAFLLLLYIPSHAQVHAPDARSRARTYKSFAKSTLASPLENLYDVHYLKLDLSMTNTGTTLSGNAITAAQVTEPSGMGQYAFELSDSLTIDSMKLNGQPVTSQSSGLGLRTVMLISPMPYNSPFTAQVFYHGTPPAGTGFFTNGVVHTIVSPATQITYTLSDPYLAKDWWPCKQSLTDKIDSADLWITVPNATKAGCNGLLKNITPVGATASRYEWKTRYPIEYYLISVSIAPYVDYTKMVHFTGSTDSMPVQHFIYDTASFFPVYKNAIDSTSFMVDYFSTLYGRYPFWKEKYGHCLAPLGGGMEHQTMTTLGVVQTPLIAHELGHQWFGDCVTYTSWRDIWMSEGWAAYTEQLYVEHFWGTGAALNYRTAVFNRVIGQPAGSVYVDDTTNVNRIFDSRLTYDKGASVAHMLRFIAPNDSTFFLALRTYQQQHAFSNATTEDFKIVVQQVYGFNVDTFFNQWVYGEGYPTYSVKWKQSGGQVLVQLNQTVSDSASVPLFRTPIELRLKSASGDTIVKVYNDQAQQFFSFTWGSTMTGLVVDPNNNILNKTGPILNDPTLAVKQIRGDDGKVFPNPAKESWLVTNLPSHATLQLFDTNGRILWQLENAPENTIIPAASLAPGSYHLGIYQSGRQVARHTLIRL